MERALRRSLASLRVCLTLALCHCGAPPETIGGVESQPIAACAHGPACGPRGACPTGESCCDGCCQPAGLLCRAPLCEKGERACGANARCLPGERCCDGCCRLDALPCRSDCLAGPACGANGSCPLGDRCCQGCCQPARASCGVTPCNGKPCPTDYQCCFGQCLPPGAPCRLPVPDLGIAPVDLAAPDLSCVPNQGPGCCYPQCAGGEKLICIGANICGYPCHCEAPDMATTCANPQSECCPPCGAGERCCVGVPFSKPTCFSGNVCPISRREYKSDIRYLDGSEVNQLGDELLKFRLARWRYKPGAGSEGEHLGFLIDDVEPSAAVAPNGQTVDLYGYTSMAVAALQAQQKEIEALKGEVEALKKELRKKH